MYQSILKTSCSHFRKYASAFLLVFFLLTAFSQYAYAKSLVNLSAEIGIGGRYRDGVWTPVNITVSSNQGASINGQIQVYVDPAGNGSGKVDDVVRQVFCTNATITSTPQRYRIYIRDVRPGSDTLVFQVVDSQNTGSGRILKKMDNASIGKTARVSGSPIQNEDLYIINLSNDISSFGFLNGQKIGVMHTLGGIHVELLKKQLPPPPGMGGPPPGYGSVASPTISKTVKAAPPAYQDSLVVAAAGPDSMPEKSAAWGAVDAVFVRSGVPLDAASEAQIDAIKGWIAAGGNLVVFVDRTGVSQSFPFRDMLPAVVTSDIKSCTVPGLNTSVDTVVVTPKPGSRVLLKSALPLIVTGKYGGGNVTVVPFDASSVPFQKPEGKTRVFWKTVLTGNQFAPTAIIPYISAHQQNTYINNYRAYDEQLTTSLLKIPALDPPTIGMVALYLLAYIIILVPLNYLILKRLDRKELTWITIPILVVLFSGISYAIGYAVKGGKLFANRISIIETSSGSGAAGEITAYGIFSPSRAAYDIDVTGDSALSGFPLTEDDNPRSPAYLYTDIHKSRLTNTQLYMWSMRPFDITTATGLKGTIDITAVFDKSNNQYNGYVANNTSHAFHQCELYYVDQHIKLKNLQPGEKQNFVIPAIDQDLVSNRRFPTTLTDNKPEGDSTQARIETSSRGYLSSLGPDRAYDQSWMDNSYIAPRNEIIFTAYNTNNTLGEIPITVNGSKLGENVVNMVIVHGQLSE